MYMLRTIYSYPFLFPIPPPLTITQLTSVALSMHHKLFFGKLCARSGSTPCPCSPILLIKSEVPITRFMCVILIFSYSLPALLCFFSSQLLTHLWATTKRTQVISPAPPYVFKQLFSTLPNIQLHTYIPVLFLYTGHFHPSICQSHYQISTINPSILFPYHLPSFVL